MVQTVHKRDGYYTYRCPHCGFTCTKRKVPHSSVPVTKTGNYGDSATPTPEAFTDGLYTDLYEAATISFTAASGTTPAYVSDSAGKFGDHGIVGGMLINVETTSGTNDGNYTVATRGISGPGKFYLSSSDSLTTENAATAGTVTIQRRWYKPNETLDGCPLCGSRNTR